MTFPSAAPASHLAMMASVESEMKRTEPSPMNRLNATGVEREWLVVQTAVFNRPPALRWSTNRRLVVVKLGLLAGQRVAWTRETVGDSISISPGMHTTTSGPVDI